MRRSWSRVEICGDEPATAVTWFVDQLENLVQTLKSKGVQFEHYNMPGESWKATSILPAA